MEYNKKMLLFKKQGTFNPNSAKVSNRLFLENDFFDSHDVIQTKYEMIRCVQKENITIKEASKSFGFSRPAFYQAQSSFEQEGLRGLFPKHRGPKNRHKLSQEIMQFVNDAMESNPSLTIKEIVPMIKKRYDLEVHARSIARARLSQKTSGEKKK
jgi:transposase